MKVIIAGSRSLTEMEYINEAVAASRFPVTEVVCGMAHGVDLLGKEWAECVGIPVKEMPANWNKFGKRAGYLRNEQMANYVAPDGGLIAIWTGDRASSPGTGHMIDIARRLRLKTYVHIPGIVCPEGSSVRDLGNKTANMYGCQPCPRCQSTYRCVFTDMPKHILCECLFMQLITEDRF